MILRNLWVLLSALYPKSILLITNAVRLSIQRSIMTSSVYRRIAYSWVFLSSSPVFRRKLKSALIIGVAYFITYLIQEIRIKRELNRIIRTNKENKESMSKIRANLREQLEKAVVDGNEVEVQQLRLRLLEFVKSETDL